LTAIRSIEDNRDCPTRFDAERPECRGCGGCRATEFLLSELAALAASADRDKLHMIRLPTRAAA
jgi:hypothetical protein